MDTLSQGQVVAGVRGHHLRWIEAVIAALTGAAITIAIVAAIVTFAASTSPVAVRVTATPTIMESGLLEQRRGERGVARAGAGWRLLDPATTEFRRGERSGR